MISVQSQYELEVLDSPDTVRNEIKAFLETQQPFMQEFTKTLTVLGMWANHDFYDSKKERLAMLKNVDMKETLWKIIIFLLISARDQELYINVAMPLSKYLGYSDKIDNIKTAMELLAVVCRSSRFAETFKRSKQGQLMIKAKYKLPFDMWQKAATRMHKPVIMSKPKIVKNNLQSAWRTYDKSVFCKSHINHHDSDVCLDALNIINKTRLSLDEEFMSLVQDEPDLEIKSKNKQYLSQDEIAELIRMKAENFNKFLYESVYHCELIKAYGNDFSINHRIDARGRIYAEGYVINPQGNDYRKSMLNFSKSVDVEIPDEFL